jgi:hypothetical protein
VANLLLLALVMVALAAMARRVEGHGGWWAATVLLVAAGLAHWMFLAVVLAILGATAVLGLPVSLRQWREGGPWWLTESGVVVGSAAAASGVIAVVVVGVLRTSFRTYEIKEDIRRYRPKLRTDLSRLSLPGVLPASLIGGAALLDRGRRERFREPLGFGVRVLLSWTAVSLIGLAYGAVTLDVPPHRFLALLVAVPGAIALAAAVDWIAGLAQRRGGILASGAVAVVAVAGLTVPGALAWYRHGPGIWIDPDGLRQAEASSAYLAGLPEGEPLVFLVGLRGRAGLISVPLKERVIRAGLDPDQQSRAHFFAGEPADLLAGRATPVRSERLRESLRPYWEDVRKVLPRDPPVIILEAFARRQFGEAVREDGATVVAPGVAVLRGPVLPGDVPAVPFPRPVPRVAMGAVWGLAILAALFAAGVGWTLFLLGPGAPPAILACSMPAVGCAVLMLGGLVAAKAGVRLGGVGGAATFAAIAAAGIVAAGGESLARRKRPDRPPHPA